MAPLRRQVKQLGDRIIRCRQCARLVAQQEQVPREKRRQYQDWHYWGRSLLGFGDPRGKLLIIGLAPAAHRGIGILIYSNSYHYIRPLPSQKKI